MDLISVILPVHNCAQYLEQAIISIQRQTYPQWELLIGDDGSTDGTPDLIKRYQGVDRRVRGSFFPKIGLVPVLNALVTKAAGSYLARMDADDISHPERLFWCAEYYRCHPECTLLGTQVTLFPESSVSPGMAAYNQWLDSLTDHETIDREILVECPLPHPTFFLRRADLINVGGYREGPWPEDYELVLRLWSAGAKFAKIPQRLVKWRLWPGKSSFRTRRYSREAFMKVKVEYLKRLGLLDRRRLIILGAGKSGKILINSLREAGHRPHHVIDSNPNRINNRINGIPVLPPNSLQKEGNQFLLIAAGLKLAGAVLRPWLSSLGYVELADYRFVS